MADAHRDPVRTASAPPDGHQRADNDFKAEIDYAHVEPHFTVIGVVDNRCSVVEMWRSRGLTCFQVADVDF